MQLEQALKAVEPLDGNSMERSGRRLDSLSKPLGSLGRLENIVVQLAGINKEVFPQADKKAVVIMCADNGVVDEGVSQVGRDVTASVTRNFMKGITGVCALSKHAGADIVVVDIGVEEEIDTEGVLNRKVRNGTWNIAKGPAMTREEAIRCIETGIDVVADLKTKGYNLLGTGEMGIGNTTTSSAIAACFTKYPVEVLVGKGAGLTSEGLLHKIEVVRQAININKPDPGDVLDVLSKVGGFDIAGLVGCFIGAAVYRIPILIDGFISAIAALCAVKLEPKVGNYILPSHGSAEPGSKAVLEELGLEPVLNLGMRLGEGTGAVIAFHIIDAALAAYTNMGTFGDAEIEQYVPLK